MFAAAMPEARRLSPRSRAEWGCVVPVLIGMTGGCDLAWECKPNAGSSGRLGTMYLGWIWTGNLRSLLTGSRRGTAAGNRP